MKLRRRLVAALAFASASIPAAGPTRAQQPAGRPFEGAPRNQHLVGHEEAELLRRIREVINDHDPRKLRDPYVEVVVEPKHDPEGRLPRRALKRQDLAQFIADPDAAVALGKAFYWEMQAGSDFRRMPDGKTFVGTACASCHYRFGADARDTNTVRIPYVAWDAYRLDERQPRLGFGEDQKAVDAVANATRRIGGRDELLEKRTRRLGRPERRHAGEEAEEGGEADAGEDEGGPRTPLSLIVGSQGVEPRVFQGLAVGNGLPRRPLRPGDDVWASEASGPRDPTGFSRIPEWAMFVRDPKAPEGEGFRQVTNRNSPAVFNSGFADRLFHDARAESTFNGFSIFGDFDERLVVHVRRVDAEGRPLPPRPVRVAIVRAALASQAVGPIVNEVEMSYRGRTFHDLAAKLLDAPVLGYQDVAADDSHLGPFLSESKRGRFVGAGSTYRAFIRRAFRRDWWDGADADGVEQPVLLNLAAPGGDGGRPNGTLMEANFSLYWGLSIMLYESSLVSNDSPYDRMAMGRGEDVDELWDRERRNLEPIYLDRVNNPARLGEPCVPGSPADPGGSAAGPGLPPTTPLFTLQSGSEVFQRGLRAFLGRGCVDCHAGPLFSEVYGRNKALEVEELKPIAIGRMVKDTLLPNSRADALSDRYIEAREDVYRKIGGLIEASGASSPVSRRVLMDFATVYGRLGGDEDALAGEMVRAFERAGIVPQSMPPRRLAAEVARAWTTFEKTAANRLGDRRFFREDQRVALAALLAEPLLVESMPIPPAFGRIRPAPPLNGVRAKNPYAFYDTSMYNLGVSLPRYDHGIGRTEFLRGAALVDRGPEAREAAVRELDAAPAAVAALRRDRPDLVAGDALERVMRDIDKRLHRAYGVSLSEELRRRLRGAVDDGGFQAAALKEVRDELDAGAKRSPVRGDVRFLAQGDRPVQAGAAGSAYKLATPGVADRRRDEGEMRSASGEFETKRRKPGDLVFGPWQADHPADADADERAANPRDLSWHRNLAHWDESPSLSPDNAGFDSVDARRADAHFLSRARALVQDEAAEGRRKPLLHDDEIVFWGSFKTPTLRNVSLTPPYMHNGRLQSLLDVVDFYDRGGDVPPDVLLNPDLHPAMLRLHLTEDEKFALVFFLMCLTDERVRHERAPFDHPSLKVINGYERDAEGLREKVVAVGGVGAGGRPVAAGTFPDGD